MADQHRGQRQATDADCKGIFTSFRANTPWLYLDIDRAQAKTLGVSMDDVFTTLQVNLASLYVNDFNRFGRTWQVNVQADAGFRSQVRRPQATADPAAITPADGAAGASGIRPAGSRAQGPVMVMRYNMYHVRRHQRRGRPGTSSGQAIGADATYGDQDQRVPQSMRAEWTELALLQLQTGNTAMCVFVLAVVLVFLVLAAQYESWSLPLAVILVVPMCLLCSIAGVMMAGMDINIFTQIGFVVLVGLACKNAILIVEFAKAQREAGVPRLRGDAGGVQAASAADHHDVVRVHPRRGAAGAGRGSRCRNAANAGHGGVRRDAGRDAVRHLSDAGVLLRDPVADRTSRPTRPGTCAGGSGNACQHVDQGRRAPALIALRSA